MISFEVFLTTIFVFFSFYSAFFNAIVASEKIDSKILRDFSNENQLNVIVQCTKSTTTYRDTLLKEVSEKSQNPLTSRTNEITDHIHSIQVDVLKHLDPVIQHLNSSKIPHYPLWISSEIYIPKLTKLQAELLAKIDIVLKIRRERFFPHIPPQSPGSEPPPQGNSSWNIGLINARCSNITCFGNGVRVGLIDTGARVTHVEIRDNWMGPDFGFLNAIDNNCIPKDDAGHGTHATGIAVGKTVGVANQATWTMCRACNATDCPESSLKLCATWLSCPYKCNDTTAEKITKDCTKTPHVINNSWGGSPSEDSDEEYYTYYEYIQHWNTLGIISTFAAGNDGQTCTTIQSPAGYDIVLDVGAVDANATLGYFSSIGPAMSTKPLSKDSIAVGTCSLKNCANSKICKLIKPTIVAPGVDITSAWNTSDTALHLHSGTSMSSPHIAGILALMICSNKNISWNYKVAYDILTRTVDTSRIDLLGETQNRNNSLVIRTNLVCNVMLNDICNSYPNNMYGYGLANACRAVVESKKLKY